jgi:hypothetical protein
MSGANVAPSSNGGGVLSFIRSFGRSVHNDPNHPSTEAPSGVQVDSEPQLGLAREGSSDATHGKDV